jgi:hypothetical protein
MAPHAPPWKIERVARPLAILAIGALGFGPSACADAPTSTPESNPAATEASPASSLASAPPEAPASSSCPAEDVAPAGQPIRRPASVHVLSVETTAKGEETALQAAIEARASALLGCYELALKLDRTLMGRVKLSFTAPPVGAIEKVKTSGDLPEALRSCVAREVEAAGLPRSTADARASATLEFQPGRVGIGLNGKPWFDVTGADVKAALLGLGATGFLDESAKHNPKRYRAMLDGKHLHVTFTPKTSPANPGAFHMSARQIDALREHSAVLQASDFVLAIRVEEDKDTAGAEALLRRIVTEE